MLLVKFVLWDSGFVLGAQKKPSWSGCGEPHTKRMKINAHRLRTRPVTQVQRDEMELHPTSMPSRLRLDGESTAWSEDGGNGVCISFAPECRLIWRGVSLAHVPLRVPRSSSK